MNGKAAPIKRKSKSDLSKVPKLNSKAMAIIIGAKTQIKLSFLTLRCQIIKSKEVKAKIQSASGR